MHAGFREEPLKPSEIRQRVEMAASGLREKSLAFNVHEASESREMEVTVVIIGVGAGVEVPEEYKSYRQIEGKAFRQNDPRQLTKEAETIATEYQAMGVKVVLFGHDASLANLALVVELQHRNIVTKAWRPKGKISDPKKPWLGSEGGVWVDMPTISRMVGAS
jgi:rRNA maturation endonuclease Nob1